MRHLRPQPSGSERSGTTLVELAVVLPVFFLFMFTLVEFGHFFMVTNALGAATRKAARYGSCDGVTTAQAQQKATELLATAMKMTGVSVIVKNASVFDSSSTDPTTINYQELPAIELQNASPRQLFIIRAEVLYSDVSLLPPMWLKNATISGQAVMRHE